jgi:hypothetical protein
MMIVCVTVICCDGTFIIADAIIACVLIYICGGDSARFSIGRLRRLS